MWISFFFFRKFVKKPKNSRVQFFNYSKISFSSWKTKILKLPRSWKYHFGYLNKVLGDAVGLPNLSSCKHTVEVAFVINRAIKALFLGVLSLRGVEEGLSVLRDRGPGFKTGSRPQTFRERIKIIDTKFSRPFPIPPKCMFPESTCIKTNFGTNLEFLFLTVGEIPWWNGPVWHFFRIPSYRWSY